VKQPSRSFLNTHHRQIPPHPTKGSEANELAQNNKDFFNKISSLKTFFASAKTYPHASGG
ncbi:hypothetical protein, partial [Actibacterium sp. 188UL27-1]|uniref:hypothetical protein n=1 Tax=Actibacterium sp. 188UL27-1 TaxID=2786961 RepID=UPI00195CC806